MIKYEFPVYPGAEVWSIEMYGRKPLCLVHDKVQMVGFTTRSIQIKLRSHNGFGKTFTWGKTVFATEDEARAAYAKMKEEV